MYPKPDNPQLRPQYPSLQSPKKPKKTRLITIVGSIAIIIIVIIIGAYAIMQGIFFHNQVSTQSTQKAQSTPTYGLSTSTSSLLYPPHGWTQVFNDAMLGTSNNHFPQKENTLGSCIATMGGYQITANSVPGAPSSQECISRFRDLTDFAVEAQVTILKGDNVGIDLRYNTVNGNTYYFWVNSNGEYGLQIWLGSQKYGDIITGSSNSLNIGYQNPNLVAIVVKGNTFSLYANGTLLTSSLLADPNHLFSDGDLGFDAYSLTNPTQVLIKDVTVWISPPTS